MSTGCSSTSLILGLISGYVGFSRGITLFMVGVGFTLGTRPTSMLSSEGMATFRAPPSFFSFVTMMSFSGLASSGISTHPSSLQASSTARGSIASIGATMVSPSIWRRASFWLIAAAASSASMLGSTSMLPPTAFSSIPWELSGCSGTFSSAFYTGPLLSRTGCSRGPSILGCLRGCSS